MILLIAVLGTLAPLAVSRAVEIARGPGEPPANRPGEVRLGGPAGGWEIPVDGPDGAPLRCPEEKPGSAVYRRWNCPGATLAAAVHEDVDDVDLALRRSVRAVLGVPLPDPDAPAVTADGARVLADPRYGAVAIALPVRAARGAAAAGAIPEGEDPATSASRLMVVVLAPAERRGRHPEPADPAAMERFGAATWSALVGGAPPDGVVRLLRIVRESGSGGGAPDAPGLPAGLPGAAA